MRVAHLERAEAVARGLVERGHLGDALMRGIRMAQYDMTAGHCFQRRSPRRADLCRLHGAAQGLPGISGKKMCERENVVPDDVLRVVRIQAEAMVQRFERRNG